MPELQRHSDGRVLYIPSTPIAFVREVGPYGRSSSRAWKRMLAWLDERGHIETAGRGYGLAHDNPHVTDESRLRYDAGVPLPATWHESDSAYVSRGTLPGGIYAVRTLRGDYANASTIISEVRDIWMPKSGLVIDPGRPVLAVYFDDPRSTPSESQSAQICLPVQAVSSRGLPRGGT